MNVNIKLAISAVCPTADDAFELCNRFYENYSVFFKNFDIETNEKEFKYDDSTKILNVLYDGIASDEFDESEFCRLTHHAEALYEDSDIEHTHVEVFVNGIWYGK